MLFRGATCLESSKHKSWTNCHKGIEALSGTLRPDQLRDLAFERSPGLRANIIGQWNFRPPPISSKSELSFVEAIRFVKRSAIYGSRATRRLAEPRFQRQA